MIDEAAPSRIREPCRIRMQERFRQIRDASCSMVAHLSTEDQCVQSMPDASPSKWHLAHTTWFFETVVVSPHVAGYQCFDADFTYLFNSYYEALGPRQPRAQRGLLTRPPLHDVMAYRRHVDDAVQELIADCEPTAWDHLQSLLELGVHHEQQHQELIATDVLHLLSCNPLLPAWLPAAPTGLRLAENRVGARWIEFRGGIVQIGHRVDGASVGGSHFAFDNETPRHDALLRPYRLADQLVSCADFLDFIQDGGYQRPEFWLSDGWAVVQAQGWRAPAYWLAPGDARIGVRQRANGSGWQVFGVHGVRPLDPAAAVSHVSFYEAAAYAAWAGARLPTEQEWEAAAGDPALHDMFGIVWQWTRSSYDPYPEFRALPGVASEYNGKFMVGQLVLRGSSAVTPAGHSRATYRNFFPPAARWQYAGIRLAMDAT